MAKSSLVSGDCYEDARRLLLVPIKASTTVVTACICLAADAWVKVLWQSTSLHGFTAAAEEFEAVCAVLVQIKQSLNAQAHAQSLQKQVQTSVGMYRITNPTLEVN